MTKENTKDSGFLDGIVWKRINWYPESPDQYPDRLPIPKTEGMLVLPISSDGETISIEALPFSDVINILTGKLADRRGKRGEPFRLAGRIPSDRILVVFDRLMQVYRVATGDSNPGMRHIGMLRWNRTDVPARIPFESNFFLVVMGRHSGPVIEALRVGEGPDGTAAITWTLATNGSGGSGKVTDQNAQEFAPLLPRTVAVPMSQVPALAEALLYTHRRTHEYDYEGPDAGL